MERQTLVFVTERETKNTVRFQEEASGKPPVIRWYSADISSLICSMKLYKSCVFSGPMIKIPSRWAGILEAVYGQPSGLE